MQTAHIKAEELPLRGLRIVPSVQDLHSSFKGTSVKSGDRAMRALIQRVHRAEVRCESGPVNRIGRGYLVLLGIHGQDGPEEVRALARRIATLRLMPDAKGVMNLGLLEMNGPSAGEHADGPEGKAGEVLLVSQFTLFADARRGRRPYYGNAAPPEKAIPLYEAMAAALRAEGVGVACGVFGDHMDLGIEADGPVTVLLDTDELSRQ